MTGGEGGPRRAPAAIALGYAVLAGGWILISDRLSGARGGQTAKGLAFVVVTAVLLLAVLLGHQRRVTAGERQLRDSQERWRTVLANSPVAVAAIDPNGVITLNAGIGEGGPPEGSLVGRSVYEMYPGNEALLGAVRAALGGVAAHTQASIGETIWDLRYQPIVSDGAVTGVIAIGANITGQVRAVEELRRSEARYRGIVETTTDGVTILRTEEDREGLVVFANEQLARIFGVRLEDLVGRSLLDVLDDDSREVVRAGLRRRARGTSDQYEVLVRRGDGQSRWLLISARPLELDGQRHALGLLSDITDRKHAEAELAYQSVHDALTGLANRVLLMDRVERALAFARGKRLTVGLLLLDLDQFKLVNDSFGPGTGDALLVEVAGRVGEAVKPEDTVARLGGDEFAVLSVDTSPEALVALAESLRAALAPPIAINGGEVFATASIGLATTPVADADTLLRNADAAMYRAKRRGPGRIETHDEQLRAQVRERLRMGSELARAIAERQLEMHYQPLVRLSTGAIVGVEALARWRHPQRGLLTAGEFIKVAEDAGLTADLGIWGIRAACADAARWVGLGPGGGPLRVSVNVSPRQLALQPLAELVEQALSDAGTPPSALVVEVTEHAVMEDAEEAGAVLRRLADSGVGVSIDDFGTGYSSMRWLTQFPISELKIDRDFVAAAPSDAGARAIVHAVVGLGSALGLSVVGEGVQTEPQRALLAEAGCALGQGFLWSAAVPADQVPALVAAAPAS